MTDNNPGAAHASGGSLDIHGMMLPGDYPRHFAVKTPEAVAIIFGDRRWTYAELDAASDAFAALLKELGVKAQDRVAYLGRNSDLFFPVFFGALRAGAVLVPINWRNTPGETRYALDDSGATLLLADQEFALIVEEACSPATRLLVIDGEDGLRGALLAKSTIASMAVDGHSPALQLYTSGTTGRPKGAIATQLGLAAQRAAETKSGHFDDWTETEVLFSPLPNFHIGGISWALTAFVRGLPLVITLDTSPGGVLDAIIDYRVTRAFMVPILVRGLIAEMTSRNMDTSTLRGIHYGAAAMDPQLLDRSVDTLGCRFLQYYGMTEASGSVTILGPTFHDSGRPHLLRSVGRPLPGFEIEIRDPEGSILPTQVPGEIWIRGPSITPGYWRQPEATREALVDGWYRSGDGGRLDEEGFLFLTDRIKDMIVSGGENVYPAEVEAALREHPAVQDCAVFGLPDVRWGEGVCAAIELRPGHAIETDELVDFVRQHLAAFKIPRRMRFDLPLLRTASGKIQRRAIRASWAAEMVA